IGFATCNAARSGHISAEMCDERRRPGTVAASTPEKGRADVVAITVFMLDDAEPECSLRSDHPAVDLGIELGQIEARSRELLIGGLARKERGEFLFEHLRQVRMLLPVDIGEKRDPREDALVKRDERDRQAQ